MRTSIPQNLTLITILKFIGIAFLLILVIWYAIFQARFLIAGPKITLTSPQDSIFSEQIITVEGTTENIVEITLNGRKINTTESGSFSKQLVLENGYTIMTLKATDRFDRDTELRRAFIYKPSS